MYFTDTLTNLYFSYLTLVSCGGAASVVMLIVFSAVSTVNLFVVSDFCEILSDEVSAVHNNCQMARSQSHLETYWDLLFTVIPTVVKTA
jgi:hypothetical protein